VREFVQGIRLTTFGARGALQHFRDGIDRGATVVALLSGPLCSNRPWPRPPSSPRFRPRSRPSATDGCLPGVVTVQGLWERFRMAGDAEWETVGTWEE
jgi:hypothetical protein